MNKSARYSAIALILVVLAALSSIYVSAPSGCCYSQTIPLAYTCISPYQSTEVDCEGTADAPNPGNIYSDDCSTIPECDRGCCCEGTGNSYSGIRGYCDVI